MGKKSKLNRKGPIVFLQYLIITLWVMITVVVFGWVISSSLKSNREIFINIWGLPSKLQFKNYVNAWFHGHMNHYVFNTVLIVVVSLTAAMVLSCTTAYAISRYSHIRWTKWVSLAFILGMSIPGQIIIVPLYVTFSKLHLLNTYTGIILVYITILLPFSVFVLTGFFRSLPRDIEDAAQIDGCSRLQIFLLVFLPMSKPGIVTVLTMNLFTLWNEYFYSMMLISDEKYMPLSAGLYNLRSQQQMSMDWASIFAGVVIMLVPTIIIFFVLQKHITRGVTEGSVKG